MTMDDFQKVLDVFDQKYPDAAVMDVRVLLTGGEWVEGIMTADINGTVFIQPDEVATCPGLIMSNIEAVKAIQFR